MPRHIVKTRAVVLRHWRMGETSKLVSLYTEDCGKLKVVAKGARRPRSKFGAALELMTQVHAVCYVREDRDLQTLSECEVERAFPRLVTSLERLGFASAAGELVERLTVEHEPNKRLYRYLVGVLGALEEVDLEQTEALFWYFQLRVAEALGYRPELNHCISCRTALKGPWLGFSPALGGGLCTACGQGGQSRVAGDSLRCLAYLQGLEAYSREAIPVSPPRCAEIRGMLRSFLEYHGGMHGRLRSLEFLEAVAEKERRVH